MAEHSFKVVKKRLLVFFGGPSVYCGFDTNHDKSWENYLMPMRLYADTGLLPKKDAAKTVWYLFEPAYKDRWDDDDSNSVATFLDDGWHSIFGGSNLARLRDATVETFKSAGFSSYKAVVQGWAKNLNSKYNYDICVESFGAPGDMFTSIASHPDYSIEQVCYFGHGFPDGLVLRLSPSRDKEHPTKIDESDIVKVTDISANNNLIVKFNPESTSTCMFFACNSFKFAREWNSVFGTAAEGGDGTLQFKIAGEKGTTKSNVLDRLKSTLTWKKIQKKQGSK